MTTTNNNKLVFISSILVICFAALIVVQMANAALQESLSTRTTKAEGVLNCNGVPIQKAYVRLFKGNSDDIGQALATTTTDSRGHFVIEGNTANFQGNEANIDPFLKLYHKCDDPAGKKGYRRVTLRYPRDFVTIGKLFPKIRRPHTIGTLNMAIKYPGEVRVDDIKGL